MWSNTLLALTLVSQHTTDYYTWIVFCTTYIMPVPVHTKCTYTYTDTEKRERDTSNFPLPSHETGWLRDRDHTAGSTSAYSSDARHGGPTKQLLFVELKWSQNEHVFKTN